MENIKTDQLKEMIKECIREERADRKAHLNDKNNYTEDQDKEFKNVKDQSKETNKGCKVTNQSQQRLPESEDPVALITEYATSKANSILKRDTGPKTTKSLHSDASWKTTNQAMQYGFIAGGGGSMLVLGVAALAITKGIIAAGTITTAASLGGSAAAYLGTTAAGATAGTYMVGTSGAVSATTALCTVTLGAGVVLVLGAAGATYAYHKYYNCENDQINALIERTSDKDAPKVPLKKFNELKNTISNGSFTKLPGLEPAMQYIIWQVVPLLQNILYNWKENPTKKKDDNSSNYYANMMNVENRRKRRENKLCGGNSKFIICGLLQWFELKHEFPNINYHPSFDKANFIPFDRDKINSINADMKKDIDGADMSDAKITFQQSVIKLVLFETLNCALQKYRKDQASLDIDDITKVVRVARTLEAQWKDETKNDLVCVYTKVIEAKQIYEKGLVVGSK